MEKVADTWSREVQDLTRPYSSKYSAMHKERSSRLKAL